MSKVSRNVIVLASVVSCVVFLAGFLMEAKAQPQREPARNIQDPYEDSTVLVEAFVVEVELAALYDMDVSPIGKKPDSVSIEDILMCLEDEDKAQVSTGAKVIARHKDNGRAESQETIYKSRWTSAGTGGGGDSKGPVTFRPYSIGTSFDASVYVQPEDRIFVRFGFEQSVLEKITSNEGRPPATVGREWSGTICLEDGRPGIAGAMQGEQKVIFLILCADIKNN